MSTEPESQSNDEHRVGNLFAQRRSRLAAFFRRRAKSADDSSDLAQEAFLRVLRADAGQAVRNPEAYLFTVAANLAREHSLLNKRFAAQSEPDDPSIELELAEWPAVDNELDGAVRRRELLAALSELSPKCRAAVILQYRDELSYREIGMRLGVSSNMVKKYLSKALRHCRERLATRSDLL